MKCYHCGQEIENGAERCVYCGAYQGAGATVVLDHVYNPYAQEPESGRTEPLQQAQPVNTSTGTQVIPAIQLPTKRGLAKMVFLSLITFGIYGVVIMCKVITELNIVASRYDGKRTMPYFAMMMLVPCTLGIMLFVWYHRLCNRIGNELLRRGCAYHFGAADFWLWQVLGSLILIGPFVFLHKFMRAMNLLNADFNANG